ncbi:MAG: DUF3592 domain-containing protein [Planctomycetota bacterium]
MLFGLPFLLAGLVAGWLGLRPVWLSYAAQSWVETTATIVTVELVRSNDEDTASVNCTYRYRAPSPGVSEAGALIEYTGTRVGFAGGSDNIGSWHEDTAARLAHAQRAGQSVPCWYNPHDPNQAVLDRAVRKGLLGFMAVFSGIFALVGGGLIAFGLHQRRKQRAPVPEPSVVAHTPLIHADGGSVWVAWFFAVLWNAISWVAFIAALAEPDVPRPAFLVIGLFPLIGLFLLWGALLTSARRLRHGRPQLRLNGGTWTTGTRVAVSVLTRTAPLSGDQLDASLVVKRRVTSGSGDDRKTQDITLWRFALLLDSQAGRSEGGAWIHAVELPLPSDLPPTAEDLTWRLEWHLVRPGPDLSATFTLPIVAGDGSATLLMADVEAQVDRAAPLASLAHAGINVGEDRDAVTIQVSAWRNPGIHISGLIAAAFVTAIAIVCWTELSPWSALLSAPIVLLSWRGALRSCLWRSTIRLSPTLISVDAGWWQLRHDEIATSTVALVDRASTMATNGNSWYNLSLVTREARRVQIARCVPERASARLADMITAVLPKNIGP